MTKTFIETPRLLLRQWRAADKQGMREMQCDPGWMANFPIVRSARESDTLVDKFNAEIDREGFSFFALELKRGGEFIGYTGLHVPDWKPACGPCVEIGWGLRRAWWGRGYVTEAALGCLDWAKNFLGLHEVVAFTTPENIKSRAVMERIGMTRVAGADFLHPKIDPKSPLALHVLYRIRF